MPVMGMSLNSSRLGVQAAVKDTWRQKLAIFEETQQVLYHTVPYHSALKTEYAFKDATPAFERWHAGSPRVYKTIQDRLLSCVVVPFQLAIEWDRFERRHDQLGDVDEHVDGAINGAFQIPDQLPLEYFNGVATSINDELVTCWDGAPLLSATDGSGAARGKVSGGNIIVGSGPDVAGLATDLPRVQQRALEWKDTAGKLVYTPQDVEYRNMVILSGPALLGVLQSLAQKEYVRTDLSNNTSESNYLKETFDFHTLAYLTSTTNFYVIFRHPYWKPFLFRPPTDLESFRADNTNSDRARDKNIEAMVADMELGGIPWAFHTVFEIDNS